MEKNSTLELLSDSIARKNDLAKLESYKVKTQGHLNIIWRFPTYSRNILLPRQGFKIHISATIHSSESVHDIVVPFLMDNQIAFKILGSNEELYLMNSNSFGYCQVGKFITIYPKTPDHAIELIDKLAKLTAGLEGPQIPSDIQIYPKSIVHYRYGKIENLDHISPSINLLETPNGIFEEDQRHPAYPVPVWVNDPIYNFWPKNSHSINSKPSDLFAKRFIILKALRQRAKGGVYIALDFKSNNANKRVILKEGRALGEINKTKIDAICRLKWQSYIQEKAYLKGLAPQIIEQFELENNYYLIIKECIGLSLHEVYLDNNFSLNQILKWLLQLVQKLLKLHEENIVFFDLSPDNIRIDQNYQIQLIDFEYAFSQESPPIAWDIGTPGFFPLDDVQGEGNMQTYHLLYRRDIYAVGSLILAAFFPIWYKKIKHFKDLADWGSDQYIEKLPYGFKTLVKRTREKRIGSYYTTQELLHELLKLIEEEEYSI